MAGLKKISCHFIYTNTLVYFTLEKKIWNRINDKLILSGDSIVKKIIILVCFVCFTKFYLDELINNGYPYLKDNPSLLFSGIGNETHSINPNVANIEYGSSTRNHR